MRSLEERYTDLIEKAKLLGRTPDTTSMCQLRDELDRLDYEIRVSVPAGERYYRLNLQSREANAFLTAADSRAQIAHETARAERARENHDAQHPTVLSPQWHPFTGLTGNAIDRAERNRRDRGLER